MQSLYVPGNTWLHRAPAGLKLGLLLAAGIGLFLLHDVRPLALAAGVALLLLWRSGATVSHVWRQTRGMLLIALVVMAFTAYFDGPERAAIVVLRLLALVFLALAVTLSTRSADLLDVCERALRPLDALGWTDSARISLALSLSLRFIPEIFRRYEEIREAQAARGLRANPVRLIVPLIVATLKSADVIAEAIDARGYPPESAGQRPHTEDVARRR